VIGLLGDTFAFTLIQEFAARLLGVQVGSYGHHVGSMHINLADQARVDAILAEADAPRRAPPDFPVDAMPAATTWSDLRAALDWEERLRLYRQPLDLANLTRLPLHPYWQRMVMLFEIHRQITRQPHRPVSPDALAALPPGASLARAAAVGTGEDTAAEPLQLLKSARAAYGSWRDGLTRPNLRQARVVGPRPSVVHHSQL
jgi:thymidylate synthase